MMCHPLPSGGESRIIERPCGCRRAAGSLTSRDGSARARGYRGRRRSDRIMEHRSLHRRLSLWAALVALPATAASAAAAPKKPAAHPAAAARPASKPFVGPPAPAKKPVARRPAARRPKKPAVAHTPLPVLPALGPLTPAMPPFQLDAMRKRIADLE